MWVWILIGFWDDSEEPSNFWAVNPHQTQVPYCTLIERLGISPGYQRCLLNPVRMETSSPSPVLPTSSGSTGCCAFHLQGYVSPGASRGQQLASCPDSGFFFDIHTTVSTSVLTDQIHEDLLWLTLNFSWVYGPKHFEAWADISSKVQLRFLLSFKPTLLLRRGSPALWLDDIHLSSLWYLNDSPSLLYRAPVTNLDAKGPTTVQCTYSRKHFNAGILLINQTPTISEVAIFFCRITLPNGAQVPSITGCYLLQSFYRCCSCDETKCLIDNSAFG